jgi:transposase
MGRNLWVGVDAGVQTASLCVIDDEGEVLQETTCPSELQAVHREIRWLRRRRSARIGLEAANGLTLARGLRSLGYSVDMYEARQLSKFLRVRRNKTDAGDAIGIAEAGRIGASLVSKVHLKSFDCQSLQSRLTIRRHLIRQRVDAVNLLCRQIELFGGRVCGCTRSMGLRKRVETEIRHVFGRSTPPVVRDLHQLLDRCEQLMMYQKAVDRDLKRSAVENEICRRFMEIPGIGPLCALSFYASISEPHRFARSKDVGCYLGLTPRLRQSGLSSRSGRISRMGPRATRSMLVQAAIGFMRCSPPDCDLRAWCSRVEEARGRGQARVALARKLAVVMLAMWKTGEPFRQTREPPD